MINFARIHYWKGCQQVRQTPMMNMSYGYHNLFNAKECRLQPTPIIVSPTNVEINFLQEGAKAFGDFMGQWSTLHCRISTFTGQNGYCETDRRYSYKLAIFLALHAEDRTI